MSTIELYEYIERRIEELTSEEKTFDSDLNRIICVAQKNELWTLKEFIKAKES